NARGRHLSSESDRFRRYCSTAGAYSLGALSLRDCMMALRSRGGSLMNSPLPRALARSPLSVAAAWPDMRSPLDSPWPSALLWLGEGGLGAGGVGLGGGLVAGLGGAGGLGEGVGRLRDGLVDGGGGAGVGGGAGEVLGGLLERLGLLGRALGLGLLAGIVGLGL